MQFHPNLFFNRYLKRILIATAALLGVILIGAGVIFFNSSIEEEQDFVSCKTKEDLEKFIKEHPSSSYVSAALKRIEALTPSIQKDSTTLPKTKTTTPNTAPVKITVKEIVKTIEQPSQPLPKKQKADDRIFFDSPKVKSTATTTSPSGNLNDDDVFYSCQTIGDYQSYLNTFPKGRHRSLAQAAINNLLNRNNNTVNYDEPASSDINPRKANQNLPPRRYRNNTPQRLHPDGNRPPQRGGHFRRHY